MAKWIEVSCLIPPHCSECGCKVTFIPKNGKWEYANYCPQCGAKMEEDDEEKEEWRPEIPAPGDALDR